MISERDLQLAIVNAIVLCESSVLLNETLTSNQVEFTQERLHVQCKEYAPYRFQQWRFAVRADWYASSFTPSDGLVSCGKLANSGSRFYLTPNRRLAIKTISHRQLKFLLQVLPQYANHLQVNSSSKSR